LLDHLLKLREEEDRKTIDTMRSVRVGVRFLRATVKNQLTKALMIGKKVDGEVDLPADVSLFC
jgi:hypothetical protein